MPPPLDGLKKAAPIYTNRPPSPSYPENDPAGAMQLAYLHIKDEMPKEAASSGPPQPMGLWGSIISPKNAIAYTTGFNNIRYDPDNVYKDNAVNADTLAHELTHVKQNNRMGLIGSWLDRWKQGGLPYKERPEENEAFAAEQKRYDARRNIELPANPELGGSGIADPRLRGLAHGYTETNPGLGWLLR